MLYFNQIPLHQLISLAKSITKLIPKNKRVLKEIDLINNIYEDLVNNFKKKLSFDLYFQKFTDKQIENITINTIDNTYISTDFVYIQITTDPLKRIKDCHKKYNMYYVLISPPIKNKKTINNILTHIKRKYIYKTPIIRDSKKTNNDYYILSFSYNEPYFIKTYY